MHFMPEDEGYEEKLWPDGYKTILKNQLHTLIASKLGSEDILRSVYEKQYREKFPDLDRFVERIADMLIVGAEKGGDAAFDEIVNVFLYEDELPEPRVYTCYLLLADLPAEIRQPLTQQVIDEYSQDEVFLHAFQVGYCDLYENFDRFLNETAKLAIMGVINGIDDMLVAIYRSFATNGLLPPARRNPKRIKNWFVPPGSKKRDIPLSRRGKMKQQKEKNNAENSSLR